MNARRNRLVSLLAMGVVAVAVPVVLGAGTAGATSPRLAVGAATRLPVGARFGPALPATRRLHLTIALQARDPRALHALATAVSTPGTPAHGRYLTVSQFARRYGATASQLASVSAALRAGGLHVGAPTANHLAIPASGTVAQVQRAFSVTEAQVRLPGGRVAFANDRAPRLAAGIARSVQAVLGLDDVAPQQPQEPQELIRPRAAGHRTPTARAHAIGSGAVPCAAAVNASTTMGGYTADEIAGAYGIGSYYPSDEGAGQTVALVEFEAYDPNDIATYEQCYGIGTSVAAMNVDGGPGAFAGDDDESALDIEQVIGLAPRANVLVYQAPANDTQAAVLDVIASQDSAKVVSSSWGACEAQTGLAVISAENAALEEMAVQGQSFVNSSGDSGSTLCYERNATDRGLSVIDPGSQPFATAVGGTFLGKPDGTTPTDGSYAGEAVWNDGGADGSGHAAAGTGGGVSEAWTMPTYQSGAAPGLGVVGADSSGVCGAQLCREVPDVSADGDPRSGYIVFVTQQGSPSGAWAIAGGTSASAPLWAAFTALADASPACRGLSLGFENPALYGIAGSAYAANFHDVVRPTPFTGATGDANHPATNDTWSGSPDNSENPGDLYPVGPGYDMATGLGSPVANVLGNSLCAVRAPAYSVRVTAPANQLSVRGQAVSLTLHATDSGGVAVSYSASGLPAGLGIDPGTGVISGTPTTRQTTAVTIRATDGFANTGATSFDWSVVTPGKPQLTSAPRLSGLGRARPKLSVAIAAGAFAPALKSVTIRLPGVLRLARTARSLAKGITVRTGAKRVAFSATRRSGALIIAFRGAVTRATLTVAGSAMTITRAQATRIRRHKVKRLTVSVKATDAAGTTTSFRVIVRKLS
jgi:subtilase family serine protease